jgi:hypothetical protein
MKRIVFFFGLLATVAVGSAFANNASAKFFEPVAGILNSTTTGSTPTCNIPDVPCNRDGGEPCNLGQGGAPLFAPTSAGLCNITLYRD